MQTDVQIWFLSYAWEYTLGTNLYALLNIEDCHTNAFSKQEEEVLRGLLNDVGAIIERRRRDNLAVAAVSSTPTAVFVVDGKGIIRDANPAAESLLGYEGSKDKVTGGYKQSPLYGKSIADYVADPEAGEALASSSSPGGELEVVTKGNKTLRVHVGGSVLEAAANRRMIIFRDMSFEIRMKDIESTAMVLADAARRVSPPLSIVALGLQELRSKFPIPARHLVAGLFTQRSKFEELIGDTVDKIVSQLHRVQLAYSELQLYGIEGSGKYYREVKFGLRQFVDDVIQEFPESDVKRLKVTVRGDLPDIYGDTFQLAFVIQTLAVHLLQLGAPSKEVEIGIKELDGDIEFVFDGTSPGNQEKYQSKNAVITAKTNIGLLLAEDTIKQFVANHRGTYYDHVIEAGKLRFRFIIPIGGAVSPSGHE